MFKENTTKKTTETTPSPDIDKKQDDGDGENIVNNILSDQSHEHIPAAPLLASIVYHIITGIC